MFYELSIQYDDPALTTLIEDTPISNISAFAMTHAYPNWYPSHMPRLFSREETQEEREDNVSLMETFLKLQGFQTSDQIYDFVKLQSHRCIHLFYTYLDSYAPSDSLTSPNQMFSTYMVRILSPLVPQGNWTTGGDPPAPSEFFYRSFPKVSPDFDNDYHVNNPGVFWGWFNLSRWLPNLIQRVLFPLDGYAYHNNEETKDQNDRRIPNARKLYGKNTPTKLECQLCQHFKGITLYNKNGDWYCVYQEKLDSLTRDNFFSSFSDYINWKTDYSEKLVELQNKAFKARDMREMEQIEKDIYELRRNLDKRTNTIKSNYIVSVRG
ncbi:hypothetical protein CAS74_000880 [Pichia kudriavzevii]|uniref:Uncharacterized protein n=1 Tax=Pichia kudriavzevii TaxID=4909 RepID=A0A099P7E8_PICKU|nr:uncharacterized protein C5L36_0C08660 [Pichia kudriavzevii]AWU76954.1 hypothetical protein C5L36_0C08660 [Pichia kudriavzevii]KGK40189.1 hypothetical protein JL09_g534 [Pichia kudriavzevii]ONH70884.1 hypothetical protein BOH78_4901 [Pichia kudriavzevii]OUT24492.1 hypothetical protein CAS74_000880 [Pichia kudriavzevii]